jgi:hypothetical protein
MNEMKPYNGDARLEARVCVLETKVEDIRRENKDVMPRPEYQRAHDAMIDKIAAVNKMAVASLITLIFALAAALLALLKH